MDYLNIERVFDDLNLYLEMSRIKRCSRILIWINNVLVSEKYGNSFSKDYTASKAGDGIQDTASCNDTESRLP